MSILQEQIVRKPLLKTYFLLIVSKICDFENLTMNLCNLDRLCVIKFDKVIMCH